MKLHACEWSPSYSTHFILFAQGRRPTTLFRQETEVGLRAGMDMIAKRMVSSACN
jgi:hypothetical protein